MTVPARTPKGTPAGGQFVTQAHSEPATNLHDARRPEMKGLTPEQSYTACESYLDAATDDADEAWEDPYNAVTIFNDEAEQSLRSEIVEAWNRMPDELRRSVIASNRPLGVWTHEMWKVRNRFRRFDNRCRESDPETCLALTEYLEGLGGVPLFYVDDSGEVDYYRQEVRTS